MKAYIFDLEGDGLEPTKIHCMAWTVSLEVDVYSTTDYDKMREVLTEADVLIGHNIQRFDIPVVERLLGIKVKAKLIDTLALSWYLFPNENRHGLEFWGERLGVKKPEITDWYNLSTEEYIHRCEEDVKINKMLWGVQRDKLIRLYGSFGKAVRLLDYIEFKMDCAREQERSGWHLDIKKARELQVELSSIVESKTIDLKSAMPLVEKTAKRKRPKLMYKMDGSLSSKGEQWISLLKENNLPEDTQKITVVTGHNEPNPASSEQIKSWLFGLGWKPRTFKLTRDSVTNEVREIPQIRKEVDGEKVLCDSVRLLIDVEPSIEILEGLTVAQHRLAIINSWLEAEKDGKIKAEIQGLTNTLRFKHKTVVNVPGFMRPYGKEIRSCLYAPKGYILCGSDQSSLEDRTKQHYMYDYDPEFVEEMNKPGFDPHLDLALYNDAITHKQAEDYKNGDTSIKGIRHGYKSANYACTYGAQPARIARELGISKAQAQKLYDGYWARNWSIEKISKNCRVKTLDGLKWLWNPVAEIWYYLKHEKDRFSTLNQGTATYCFDTWVKFIREKRKQLTAQFHDEIVLLIKEGFESQCEKLLRDCEDKTNELLKLNRKLDIGVDFGRTYADIH